MTAHPPRDLQAATDALTAAAHRLYTEDKASQLLGMRLIEVRAGHARISMRVRADMINGHRICHGGLIFCLADSAFAYACNAGRGTTVASGGVVEFLRPAYEGDELIATATERARSRRTGVYDVEVRNQAGDCIALIRGRSHELGAAPAPEPDAL